MAQEGLYFLSYSCKQFYFSESLALALQHHQVPVWFDGQCQLHAVIPGITALVLEVILVAQFVTATPPPHYPDLPPQYLGGAIATVGLIIGLIWVLVIRASRPVH